MLAVLLYLESLRWVVPAFLMLSPSPLFFAATQFLRLAKPVIPSAWFQRGDETTWSVYQRVVLFFFENYVGNEILLYGDAVGALSSKENAIFLSNHQSTVDWIVVHMAAIRQGSTGNVRIVFKDGLRYLPMYGLYIWEHGCVPVSRSGAFSEERTVSQLRYIKEKDLPTWLVIFPEGTRFKPSRHTAIQFSQTFARSRGLTALENHLTPRAKATQLAIQNLRGHTEAVYDVTIAYESSRGGEGERTDSPSMADFLAGRNSIIHLHFTRIPLEDIPNDDYQIKDWLHNRFVMKDQLMQRFLSTGRLSMDDDEVPQSSRLPLRSTLPPTIIFCAATAGVLACPELRSAYWKILVYGSLAGIVFMRLRG